MGSYLPDDELREFIATLPTRRLASAAVIRDEHGEEVAVLPMHREYITFGLPDSDGVVSGMESLLSDISATLSLRIRMTSGGENQKSLFTLRPPFGKRPREVLPALHAAAALCRSHTWTLAPAFGPSIAAPRQPLEDERLTRPALFWRDLTVALNRIQEHTATPLSVPSAETLKEGLGKHILQAGALLGGETLEVSATAFAANTSQDHVLADGSTRCALRTPFQIDLPEEIVTYGLAEITFVPDGVESVDTPDGPRLQWNAKDGRAEVRLHKPEQA